MQQLFDYARSKNTKAMILKFDVHNHHTDNKLEDDSNQEIVETTGFDKEYCRALKIYSEKATLKKRT